MKKIIKKFWGVGLIVMLLSSLFVAAAPVSAADPLNWEFSVDMPSALFFDLAPGTDVNSYDIDATGMVMYAVLGNNTLVQSTTGGAMWSNITARLPAADFAGVFNYVAMAPDNKDVIVVATATPTAAGLCAAISVNAGATWTSMGPVQDLAVTPIAAVSGIAISPTVTGGFRYIVIYGNDGVGPAVNYYNYGAGVGSWKNAALDFVALPVLSAGAVAYDNCVGFKFSGAFPSDFMATALLTDVVAGNVLDFHILSFNSFKWDTPVAAGYPSTVYAAAAALVVNAADIELNTEYDGSDETSRMAFVGAAMTDGGGEIGGVWRCFDSAPPAKIFGSAVVGSGTAIASVAYDGTNAAAGAYDTNEVYRSADPLVTSPTWLPSRNYKKIGVSDPAMPDFVILKFVGATLYGAKGGNASCLSKSADYGNVWTDFTLLDNAITTANDIWVSATGNPWYMAANDATTTAIYRINMFNVDRVLCVYPADATGFALRGLGSDAGVLYAFDTTAPMTTIFYSADGGTTRWYKRIAPAAVNDLAVESAQVIYIGNLINVYKSINSGFTWGLPVNCKLTGANAVYSMVSLGEGKLLVGGTAGGVVWSTDGGATWFASLGVFFGGNMLVAATGLAAGDWVFAADRANNNVWRCDISPANFLGEFKTMNNAAATAAEVNRGLILTNGVLYVLAADAAGTSYINSTLAPTIPGTHSAIFWRTRYAEAGQVYNRGVNSIRACVAVPGTIKLMAIDTTLQFIYYFDDTVALNGPALIGPADKSKVDIVSALTGVTQPVNFIWSRLSKATSYNLFVALDDKFTRLVLAPPAAAATVASSADPVSSIQNAGGLLAPLFQPGTTYYWRVAANLPTTSMFSATRSFTVQPTAATVPSISSPAVGATVTTLKPAFSWSPVAGATKYRFQVSEGTAFAAPIYDTETTVAGAQLPLNISLEDGKTYFWRVKALAPVESDWSSIANLTVAIPVVTTPAPPVQITQVPAPVITIPPAPAPTTITIPPPPAEKVINPSYIWAIIIIGAVLVIAVIVLIVRTRRSV